MMIYMILLHLFGLDEGFTIPMVVSYAMQCIKMENEDKRRRALVPSVRNEIVHVLASSFATTQIQKRSSVQK